MAVYSILPFKRLAVNWPDASESLLPILISIRLAVHLLLLPTVFGGKRACGCMELSAGVCRWSGWRAAYVGDVLGWHDRARTHFDNYAASQVTEVPNTISHPAQDSALALARSARYGEHRNTATDISAAILAVTIRCTIMT